MRRTEAAVPGPVLGRFATVRRVDSLRGVIERVRRQIPLVHCLSAAESLARQPGAVVAVSGPPLPLIPWRRERGDDNRT